MAPLPKGAQQDRKSGWKSARSVGVVGFGTFGRFMAPHLARAFASVSVTDSLPREQEARALGLTWDSLDQLSQREVVVLAVPLQNLETVLQQISPRLRPDALVVDVCSVKRAPIDLMLKYLPASAEIVGTHPLFGPQSAKDGLAGHRVAFCPVRIAPERAARFRALLADGFGLRVFEREPDAHDREMAMVQALTHFVARALKGSGIERSELATVSYTKLCEAMELLAGDSWELFKTIELGNPFAPEVRARFVKELKELEQKLAE